TDEGSGPGPHRQPATGTEAADSRLADPFFPARHVGIGHQSGVARGRGMVGKGVGARRVVGLQGRGRAGTLPYRSCDAHYPAFVVRAHKRDCTRTNPDAAAKRLDGVAGLCGVTTVEPHPATELGGRVLRTFRATREHHQLVPGRSIVGFLDAPTQAFLRQQSADEVEITLPVLRAIAARPYIREERSHL